MINVPHNRLTFGSLEAEAVHRVVLSGQWAMGSEVERFEDNLGAALRTGNVCAVSNGLEALRLALCSLDLEQGESVIVPAYCCVAIINAVLAAGGRPVPVDINENLVVDTDAAIDAARKEDIRIAVVVHTFGTPAPIDPLKSFGLQVIEDCAHGFGSDCSEGRMGTLGTLSTFSFYATKFIGAGEGGAIASRDSELIKKIKDLRDYTDKAPSAHRLNSKMTNILAALAVVQLGHFHEFTRTRRHIAMEYRQAFSALASGRLLTLPGDTFGRIWYRFPLRFHHFTAKEAVKGLKYYGVEAALPIEDWRAVFFADENNHLNADAAYREIVSLPIYPTLGEDERIVVMRAVNSLCRG